MAPLLFLGGAGFHHVSDVMKTGEVDSRQTLIELRTHFLHRTQLLAHFYKGGYGFVEMLSAVGG
jgi:hypothetical protein